MRKYCSIEDCVSRFNRKDSVPYANAWSLHIIRGGNLHQRWPTALIVAPANNKPSFSLYLIETVPHIGSSSISSILNIPYKQTRVANTKQKERHEIYILRTIGIPYIIFCSQTLIFLDNSTCLVFIYSTVQLKMTYVWNKGKYPLTTRT